MSLNSVIHDGVRIGLEGYARDEMGAENFERGKLKARTVDFLNQNGFGDLVKLLETNAGESLMKIAKISFQAPELLIKACKLAMTPEGEKKISAIAKSYELCHGDWYAWQAFLIFATEEKDEMTRFFFSDPDSFLTHIFAAAEQDSNSQDFAEKLYTYAWLLAYYGIFGFSDIMKSVKEGNFNPKLLWFWRHKLKLYISIPSHFYGE